MAWNLLTLSIMMSASPPYELPPPLRERLAALLVLLLALLLGASDAFAASDAGPDFEQLLAGDDAEAQFRLGQRYEHGEGVPRDVALSVRLYCHAAARGSADAEYALGWLYANAREVTRDDRLAAPWFARAAAQGDQYATRMLARLDLGSTAVDTGAARCVMPDGTVYSERRIPQSVPDPAPALIVEWVTAMAPEFDLEPSLVLAVIRAASGFDPRALSPRRAMGLMQLIPETATRFGVENPWDPVQNIRGGMSYLRWLLDFFHGDERLALAGYNAGERAVQAHGGIPPYPETRAYVKRVSLFRARATSRLDPS